MRKIILWVCNEDGENREFIVDDFKQYIAVTNIVAETHAQEEGNND